MMTKAQIRKYIIELLIVAIVSVLLFSAGSITSARKADNRLQKQYIQEFSNILPAASYDEITGSIIDKYPEIQAAYVAYDKKDEVIGYVVDVIVTNEDDSSIHLMLGINDTSGVQTVNTIKRIDDEEIPLKLIPEEVTLLNTQLIGKELPVALISDSETLIVNDDASIMISGLTDGTFYAQKQFADRYGYIDYVEIEVKQGLITRVQWNAFNVDPTTPDRQAASLMGSYDVVGDSWASQSYNLCHALMDLQDPDRLAMKSDGTTEIIDGVNTNIRPFVELAKECIANSKNGYTKEDYSNGMDKAFMNLFSLPTDELGLPVNDKGFVVYSFSDYPNFFSIYDESGEEIRKLNIREYDFYVTTGYVPAEDNEITEIDPNNSGDVIFSDGDEDGVVIGYESADLTNNIDGLPKSEIKTYFEGAPMSQPQSKNVATAINITYIFLKEYID